MGSPTKTTLPPVSLFIILTMLHYSGKAQNCPQDYLNAHNTARAEVGVQPMTWDENVAAYAKDYANQHPDDCELVHSSGPYGENLAEGSGELTGTDAVSLWVGEKSNYDYSSNACTGGMCGHYNQVVWNDSARLGSVVLGFNVRMRVGLFLATMIQPPGNVIGQSPY